MKALLRRYHVYMGKASGTGEEKENYLEMGGIRIHEEFNEIGRASCRERVLSHV